MPVVAFQGERGAYSDEAALSLFGETTQTYPCKTFSDVFAAVAGGTVDLGLVPVENSQAGSINDVYDLLRQHELAVIGEICHPVKLCLMALPGQSMDKLHRVISHPVALAQCDPFLRQLSVEIVATYDTAGSAKMIREGELQGVGAVAGVGAARTYGLEILAESIQTVQDNFTRFVVISRSAVAEHAGPQKSMLVMGLRHEPGALYRALGSLASRGIDLLKLESRPSKATPWEYVFYLDIVGHQNEPAVQAALAELQAETTFMRVLGSFKRDTSLEVRKTSLPSR